MGMFFGCQLGKLEDLKCVAIWAMGVSTINGVPKMDGLWWKIPLKLLKWMVEGYPYLRNHHMFCWFVWWGIRLRAEYCALISGESSRFENSILAKKNASWQCSAPSASPNTQSLPKTWYPLVNWPQTVENYHFCWENSGFRLGHGFQLANSYVSHYQMVYPIKFHETIIFL